MTLESASVSTWTGMESPRARFLRRFRASRAAVFSVAVLVSIALLALAAPLVAPYDPDAQALARALEPSSGDYLLGTDDLGRDVLSRLIFGARISLLAALQAVTIAVVLGVLPGLVAGYAGGRVDAIVMRIADAIMSFPPIILAIAIVAVIGPGLTNAMVALGIIFSPRFVRVARAAASTVREEAYVEAARSLGTPTFKILRKHVLPNTLSPIIVQVTITAGIAMLAEAGLSFLGLGVQPPESSWGAMLGRGFRYLNVEPLLVVWPGVAISITVLAFNVVGDGLRDALGREVHNLD